MPYLFRAAEPRDLDAVTDIYNAAVLEGGSTADLTARTPQQRRAWLESHHPPYGVFVVERDGNDETGNGGRGTTSDADRVVAFGALSVYYDRAGYDGVVDLAYYVAPEARGGGAGRFLLERLLDEARRRGMRQAIGIVFADNAASGALLESHGFTRFGLLPQAATDAVGRMHDMAYWRLAL